MLKQLCESFRGDGRGCYHHLILCNKLNIHLEISNHFEIEKDWKCWHIMRPFKEEKSYVTLEAGVNSPDILRTKVVVSA